MVIILYIVLFKFIELAKAFVEIFLFLHAVLQRKVNYIYILPASGNTKANDPFICSELNIYAPFLL